MHPLYDSPLNPVGIDLEEAWYDFSSFSIEELWQEEKRIMKVLQKRQDEEPSRKRCHKSEYDNWIRSIAHSVNELQCVRDEIEKRNIR